LQQGKAKYYDAGKLERELEFKDNERNGTARYYGKSGDLAFELYYDDGLITGYAYLDRTKKLVKPVQLVNFTGTVEAYYSNGAKSAYIEVASGVYHGKYNLFNEKGGLTYESTEEYGKTTGTVKTYYDNGKLRTESSQLYDLFDGLYKEYYPDGKIKEEVRYEAGNVHGPYKMYDQTGKLVETRFYHYGYLQDIKK
jgi:uncharacterized protein